MSDKNSEGLHEIAKVLFDKHMTIKEKMCIEELVIIIDEQIKSGDFMQHICQADNSFGLTYIPFREVDRLEQKLQAAEEKLTECGANYWKEVEKRKAAEEENKRLRRALEVQPCACVNFGRGKIVCVKCQTLGKTGGKE